MPCLLGFDEIEIHQRHLYATGSELRSRDIPRDRRGTVGDMGGIGGILSRAVSVETGWGQACQDWCLALWALKVVPPPRRVYYATWRGDEVVD